MKSLKLKLRKTSFLIPTKPFNFDTTFFKPDHFTSGDNFWQPGVRWQTWLHEGVCLGLKFQESGTAAKPKVRVKIYAKQQLPAAQLKSLLAEIHYRYNLDLELKDFYRKFGSQQRLQPVLRRLRGMRPGHPSSLYEYLIIGIVLQNATVRRSIQMFRALLENFGTQVEFGGKQLWCFWQPGRLNRVSEQRLRGLKVGYRAKSIKKIDEQFSKGLLEEMSLRQCDRETQMIELLKLYGVGPATVWYLLFDVFHHWDFFNHVSPWEQKIYSQLFFNQSPEKPVGVKRILKYFKSFGAYKQLAVHYVWEDLWWQYRKGQADWLKKYIRS